MFFNRIRVTAKYLQTVNYTNINYITPIIQLQKYSDWYHRQPVRIVNEEEILQHVEAAEGPNEFIGEKKPRLSHMRNDIKPLKVRPKQMKKKKIQITPSDCRLRDDGSLNITELTEDDKTLTTLMMSVRSKKKRDINSRIILEGQRLIVDAIDSGAIPEIIVFSRTSDILKLPLPEKGIKLYKVPYRAIQTWSTLITSPGVMGFFQIPDVENTKPAANALPLTIICDNVRDPGNLGSIIRGAAAVGCKKLITLIGCVNIWDSKVLKSAAGCHFRMPIFASKSWDDIPTLVDPFANVFVADNSALIDTKSTNNANEFIETEEEEHMNCKNNLENESVVEINEHMAHLDEEEVEEIHEENRKKPKTNYQRILESNIAKKLTANVPVIPYYATNYTENENIVVIGGETLGLSLEALDMVKEKCGVRINIPMSNGVDSLNTGMALGIIAFEIRRQHAVSKNNKNT